MNTFPPGVYPQFQHPHPGFPPGGGGPGPQQPTGVPIMTDPQLAMIHQQGYIQQQQQLAAMASGVNMAQMSPGMHMGGPGGPGGPGGRPGMPPPSSSGVSSSHKKKKHSSSARNSNANAQTQVLARHMQAIAPPHPNDHYLKNAMAPPGMPPGMSPGMAPAMPPGMVPPGMGPPPPGMMPPGMPGAMGHPGMDMIEPWADSLDELDARELAMGRYRSRHEIMAEVFGPEHINEIVIPEIDPWDGLGIDGETLEAKVLALETGNAELEAKMDSDLEAFRKRLEAADQVDVLAA